MITENLKIVEENIAASCKASGRNRDDVVLIAVSKTKPEEMIREAYAAGIRDFGENKSKELLTKKELLPEDIRWHMIGHLQTNKVRQLVGNAFLIHSIDSVHLADAIEYESAKKGIVTEGLIEINVAEEESKHGFPPVPDPGILEHFAGYRNLRIRGLMTVAPDVEDSEQNRAVFRRLRALSVDIAAKKIDNISMEYLSMGMTGDYTVAVEEGASFVRVGTGIFGKRERMEN